MYLELVTILILVDGFLQYVLNDNMLSDINSHNPYFSRWFSAIFQKLTISEKQELSHNPYFSRWFSAISTHKNCY